MGVADDNPIGPQHYPTIAEYMRDLYKYVDERYTRQVPVLIWFAWSDLMRNAGIIDSHGNPKAHVYDAFRAMRNRELSRVGRVKSGQVKSMRVGESPRLRVSPSPLPLCSPAPHSPTLS
jgi:hypothetical protein